MIRPLPCSPHRRSHQLGEPGQPEDVDLELPPRLVQRHVLDRAVGAVPRVVDEYVDPAVLVEDPLDAGGHGRVVGDVHPEHAHPGVGQGDHPVDAAGDGVHLEPGLLQAQRGLLADPAGSSGDQGDAWGVHGGILA